MSKQLLSAILRDNRGQVSPFPLELVILVVLVAAVIVFAKFTVVL